MRKSIRHSLTLLAAAAALALSARADTLLAPPTGELSPASGDLTGAPGDTVIWGITLTNTDPNGYWWALTGVQSSYTSTGAPGEIPDGPNFFTDDLSGYFLDNFFANGTALAPGEDINLASPGDPVNLAEFAISPTATAGTILGTLYISYDEYAGNPLADPDNPLTPVGSDVFDADTSVTVVATQPQMIVPEPGTFGMGLGAVLGWAVFWKARRRARAGRQG